MGERLLMAIRDGGLRRPVWLYHHWAGTEAGYLHMVGEVWVKDKPTNATDWVKGLLNRNERMEIANEWHDYNYLGAILVGYGVTYVAWVPMDSRNWGSYYDYSDIHEKFEKMRRYKEQFIRAVNSETYPKGTIDELEKVVKSVNYYRWYVLTNGHVEDALPLLRRALELREGQLEQMRQWEDMPEYYLQALEKTIAEIKELIRVAEHGGVEED